MASIACSMFISYDKEVGQTSSSKLVRKNNERILLRGIGNKKGFLKKNLLHKNSKKVILLTTSFKTYFQFKSIGFHPTFEEKNVMNKWREMQITTVAGVLALLLFVVPSANAVDVGETYSCILKGCWVEMLKCIANPSCAASIACIESCNNRPDEIECEVRCGDLFQNNVINEFNNCAVSRKKCIKQKMDTGEYPVPDPGALVKNFKVGDLSGNWYITSGLNPIFDHFDCQTQEFHIESNDVLMANLSWRISTPGGGFFTRSTTLRFVQDQFQDGILHNHGNDYLNYQDDWYILSSKIENTEDDYVFVYYRGSNDAWDGYGGSIVFTKSSVLPDSIIPELVTTSKKIGLDFNKFVKTDNTCGPHPPLFERLRSLWKK